MNSRIKTHNREVVSSAEFRAREMIYNPSPLEERMKNILDSNWVMYEPQRIFYIYADDGWINRYYIADFFIPQKNLIIEVDGKFHDKHKQHDKMRTKEIKEHYPDVEVLRYKWKDLDDTSKMKELLYRIHR